MECRKLLLIGRESWEDFMEVVKPVLNLEVAAAEDPREAPAAGGAPEGDDGAAVPSPAEVVAAAVARATASLQRMEQDELLSQAEIEAATTVAKGILKLGFPGGTESMFVAGPGGTKMI